MQSEWPIREIGTIASSISDTHRMDKSHLVFLNTSDILFGKFLHHNYSEVKNWPGQAKKSIQQDDILFSEIIPANGHWALVDFDSEDYVVSTKLMVIRADKKKMYPKFLYQFLTSPTTSNWLQHLAESRSGTFPQITFTQIASLKIPVPPLEVQRVIAETLGILDERIDNLHQTNTTLQSIASTLFKSRFVDFDSIAQDELHQSEFGLIPKGWRIGSLADLCELNASKWTAKEHPPTVRYIDLSGVSCNRIEAVSEFEFDEAPSRARLHLREGDTIVGTVRPGNRAFAYIHEPEVNLTGSTGFAVLSPREPHFSSFVYLAATRDEAIERLANLADGAAYPAVRPNVVAETPCVIAPTDILAEFSTITKPLLERVVKNRQQAATLAALRDTLLPRLISGRLRISETVRQIVEVTA